MVDLVDEGEENVVGWEVFECELGCGGVGGDEKGDGGGWGEVEDEDGVVESVVVIQVCMIWHNQ